MLELGYTNHCKAMDVEYIHYYGQIENVKVVLK